MGALWGRSLNVEIFCISWQAIKRIGYQAALSFEF
jgi:hypothetical protein